MKSVQFIDSIRLRLSNLRKKSVRSENLKIYAIKYIPMIFMFLFVSGGLFKILALALWWLIITVFYDHRVISQFQPTIRIWFGVPGSGKTSMGAWLARASLNHHYKVLSNVEIQGTYKLNEEDLGKYDMSFDGDGCHVIYDEATANGLDNRDFKHFSKDKKSYFSLHRHMNNRVDVFSQDYDVDLKIKGRAGQNGLFHLSRLPIKGFVMYRRIRKIFFIKKDDKQFIDGFEYAGLPRVCYVKSVWHSFDTLDMSMCPKEQKQWSMWGDTDND